MLSAARAALLEPRLSALLADYDYDARIEADPIEFPRRHSRPEDIELVALLATSLAYGNAKAFKPKLAQLLAPMGKHPADFARNFDPKRDAKHFEGFVYRFNVGADLAVLVSSAGRLSREHGGLGKAFEAAFRREQSLRGALTSFVAGLRGHIDPAIEERLGKPRDLAHLLPNPEGGSSCKRLLLYLRWMVRGPDRVDFGLWDIPKSALVIPLDTHIGRISRFLGLTARSDLSWRTAEEITASLRRLDPEDPVKYDFALCHTGMSGACPARSHARTCAPCGLLPACRKGPQVLRRAARTQG